MKATTPSVVNQSATIDEDRFHDLIAEYLRRIDRGERVDRPAFVASHPEFAAALQAYFDKELVIDAITDTPTDGLDYSVATESVADGTTADMASQANGIQHTPQIPETFGRYRVLKALGHGAMGDVYLAQDQQLGRHVALKIPKFNKTDTSGTLERFYREARSAALLRHSNICPVFDVGEIEGQHYISMAYIEGRPLSDLIRAGQLPSETQVAVIVRKLALGLADAHSHGVIHRDLKPANIRGGNFTSVADLESQLREFITYYNTTMAHPFAWTYTGKPLQKQPRPKFVSPHRRVKLSKSQSLERLITSCNAV